MKNRFEFRFALELRLEIDPILRRRSSTGVCIFLDMYARARARARARAYVHTCKDSPFDAPVSPEATVKSLERTHVGVLGGNDLLCEAQATRWMMKLVYRAIILQLVAVADRR